MKNIISVIRAKMKYKLHRKLSNVLSQNMINPLFYGLLNCTYNRGSLLLMFEERCSLRRKNHNVYLVVVLVDEVTYYPVRQKMG